MERNEIPNISFKKSTTSDIEFEILSLSTLFEKQKRLKYPLDTPHRVSFYHIIYITKGSGKHYIDFQPYPFEKGSVLFISVGQIQSYDINENIEGTLVLFSETFVSKNLIHSDLLSLHRLYNYHSFSPVIQPWETGDNNFEYLFRGLECEYQRPEDFAKEESLRLLLKLLLLRAERVKRSLVFQDKNSEWMTLFSRFRDKLIAHHLQTRSANEYASMLEISYKHLNTVCKSIVGTTAKEFIDSFVVLEVKRQLATRDISVKELAFQFGFDEPTNFVKYFKKHCSQTPTQFRDLLKK